MSTESLTSRIRRKFARRPSVTPSVSSSASEQDHPSRSKSKSIAQTISKSLRPRGLSQSTTCTLPRDGEHGRLSPISIQDCQKSEELKISERIVAAASPVQTTETSEPQRTSTAMEDVVAHGSDNGDGGVGVGVVENAGSGECHYHSSDKSTTATTVITSKGLELNTKAQPYSSSTSGYPTPASEFGGAASTEDKTSVRTSIVAVPSRAIPDLNLVRPTPPFPPFPGLDRKQSILPPTQSRLIRTLLEPEATSPASPIPPNLLGRGDYFSRQSSTLSGNMVRKVWVKRPSASATLVTIGEDDLVDDVRDMILKKYANSLGRNFDSPDVTLKICPREPARQERQLGPEEHMCKTIDAYFPGGQTVDDALIIDVPTRRTPKPSPRGAPIYYDHDMRPVEGGDDYFPRMPLPAVSPGPHLNTSAPAMNGGTHHLQSAMSVINTGHVPPIPSPGGRMTRGYTTVPHHNNRPQPKRQLTSSPNVNNGNPNERSNTASHPPAPPPLPTPPVPEVQRASTPEPRVSSPRPTKARKPKKPEHPHLPSGMLSQAVPPINVLIVEDNIINLRLLEAFMKRLKVRWQTAMDGRQAVTKWRAGGFHLVLMDIQLPVMSGLEATREIRRLEKLNSIGVFSSSASSSAPEQKEEPGDDDKLPSSVLFKSPVIIVALTASSLQSDRHEALAAGCNDFLTKPVNFVWLERKVMEWGCMQALIDFDGWRKWKDFSQQAEENDKGKNALVKKKRNRNSLVNGGLVRASDEAGTRRAVGVTEG